MQVETHVRAGRLDDGQPLVEPPIWARAGSRLSAGRPRGSRSRAPRRRPRRPFWQILWFRPGGPVRGSRLCTVLRVGHSRASTFLERTTLSAARPRSGLDLQRRSSAWAATTEVLLVRDARPSYLGPSYLEVAGLPRLE